MNVHTQGGLFLEGEGITEFREESQIRGLPTQLLRVLNPIYRIQYLQEETGVCISELVGAFPIFP